MKYGSPVIAACVGPANDFPEQLHVLQQLLAISPDILTTAQERSRALGVAARDGDVELAKFLYSFGPCEGPTKPCGHACHPAKNSESFYELLMQQSEFNLELKDCAGMRPLEHAVLNGLLGAVTSLLKAGARRDHCHNKVTPTLLHVAACKDNSDTFKIVELLLDLGEDINYAKGDASIAPIHIAVRRGGFDMMSLHVQHGANTEVLSADGTSLLHWSCHSGSLKCVASLLEKGALVDATDRRNRTPLHSAVISGSKELTLLMLRWGACPDGSSDGAPLAAAVSSGNSDMVALLLLQGARADIIYKGHSMVELAVASSSPNTEGLRGTLELLLTRCSPNIPGSFGITPLHIASEKNNTAAMTLLLEHSASVNVKDDKGLAAIHHSIWARHAGAIKLLRDVGVAARQPVPSGWSLPNIGSQEEESAYDELFMIQENLHSLVAAGDLIEFPRMLKRVPEVWIAWIKDEMLAKAIVDSQTYPVKLLLEAGADPLSFNMAGFRRMGRAFRTCHDKAIFTYLHDYGASLTDLQVVLPSISTESSSYIHSKGKMTRAGYDFLMEVLETKEKGERSHCNGNENDGEKLLNELRAVRDLQPKSFPAVPDKYIYRPSGES